MTTEDYIESSDLTDGEDEYNKKNTIYSMYKIVPKNKESIYCYVGHTANFFEREKQHFSCSINIDNNKHHQLVYQTIRNNGGWDEWNIAILEELKDTTRIQSQIKEQEWIDKLQSNLNMLKAHITEEQTKEYNKKYNKDYYLENKEKLAQYSKEYHLNNKEYHRQYYKEYNSNKN